jgi:GNAT superfamily N-acetyltransferase
MVKFKIINELNEALFEQLDDVIKTAYWTDSRNEKDYKKMIENTGYFVGVVDLDKNRLVGITRVLTDFTYIATIVDVIVHEDYRNFGIGKMMLNHIVDCKELKEVKNIELYCKDELVPYYSQFGLKDMRNILNFMRVVR